jgi:hypothetical protein
VRFPYGGLKVRLWNLTRVQTQVRLPYGGFKIIMTQASIIEPRNA